MKNAPANGVNTDGFAGKTQRNVPNANSQSSTEDWAGPRPWSVLHLGWGYHGDPGVEVRSESRLYGCRSVCLEWSKSQAGGGTREP